jgi:hypothetical protein
MKTYSTITPSIIGVLSDDNLYFEGLSRPAGLYTVRDQGEISGDSVDTLEKYFNDVYNLFLRKLSAFAGLEHTSDEETAKLQALLQELIKVKGLIEGVTAYEKKGTESRNLL